MDAYGQYYPSLQCGPKYEKYDIGQYIGPEIISKYKAIHILLAQYRGPLYRISGLIYPQYKLYFYISYCLLPIPTSPLPWM